MVTPFRTGIAGPTDADLDFVRALLEGPHDELELALIVVTYRNRLLSPFRDLVQHWRVTGGREHVEPALLVGRAVDRAMGVAPGVPS